MLLDVCVFQAVAAAAQRVADLYNEDNFATLDADFNLCNPLASSTTPADDAWVLMSNLMGNVQGAVQYNDELRWIFFFFSPSPSIYLSRRVSLISGLILCFLFLRGD